MNLRKVDLNLLVIFDALMQERNVTRAASKVALSQPAFSNALSRLRHYLKDELFVRTTQGMVPTARARDLAPQISNVISILHTTFEPAEFDPLTDSRVFTVEANDYLVATTIAQLMGPLGEVGPNINVRIVQKKREDLFKALDSGEIDFAIGPYVEVPERYEVLYIADTDFVCMMRFQNPLAEGKLTLSRFAKATHLLVSPSGAPFGFVDEALAREGLKRRIGLSVNHFSVVPPIVANSDMIVTIPRRIAKAYQKAYQFKLRPSPFSIPKRFANVTLIWHKEIASTEAHRWFKSMLIDATAGFQGRSKRKKTDA